MGNYCDQWKGQCICRAELTGGNGIRSTDGQQRVHKKEASITSGKENGGWPVT